MKMRKMKIFLSSVLSGTLAITGIFGNNMLQNTKEVRAEKNGGAEVQKDDVGYLFAYFTDSSKAIHFAVSTDGYHYTALNGNRAVVSPTVGRKSVRDPYIIKGQSGDYYMMATDLKGGDSGEELKVNSDNSYTWGANTSIVTWHSTDLVQWEQETKIDILGEYAQTKDANQTKVWAPEAVYDVEKGEYMLYWSMEGGSKYGKDLMIWYAYTKDFQTLTSEPEVLFNPGKTGLNLAPVKGSKNTDCIDANIVGKNGKYYMYYKWSAGKNAGIQVAVADSLTGKYLPMGYDEKLTATQTQSAGDLCGSTYVEGGDAYQINGEEKWLLIADHNWSGHYGMAESDDLIHWKDVEECTINFSEGDGNPKHGAVIPITAEQYNALWAKWEGTEVVGTDQSTAESSNSALQKVSVSGATEIREEIDSEHHIITKYISRNNSPFVDIAKASLEFTVSSGYKVSDWKGINNLEQGAEVTVVSVADSSDAVKWTVKAVTCNNPALPGVYADPDIKVFNGKYYIYPTTDGFLGWNTQKFHVFSSDDMVDWKDEGVILDLSTGDVAWVDTETCNAWAPAIERKNGKYYFYFCGRDKSAKQQAIGVAVADSPTGPFVAEKEPLMTSKKCSAEKASVGQVIDPAIYTDEETGVSYMLFGNGRCDIVELNDDMVSYKAGTIYRYPDFKDFRESIHVLKKNGKYHFTWSCDDTGSENYSIRYAVSDSLFPDKKEDGKWGTFTAKDQGLILAKDPENDILGTGHHCMLQLPGTDEWYIAYARFGTPLSAYPGNNTVKGTHREVCLEKVSFGEDGKILPIKPTLAGIQEKTYAGYSAEYRISGDGMLKDETGNLLNYKKAYFTRSGEGSVTLTAVPNERSKFIQWSDGVKTATRTDTGLMKDQAVTAIFESQNKPDQLGTSGNNQGDNNNNNNNNDSNDKENKKDTVKKGTVKKVRGLSVKNKKARKAVLKWKKMSNISGYEIYMSTKKSKGYKKIAMVKKASVHTFTRAKLKKKKTYYFKVRAYKKMSGKTVKGNFSSVKKVKIKK